VLSTMQDAPLLVSGILRHGQHVYGESLVRTVTDPAGGHIDASFTEVANRAEQLAGALDRLGVGDGDRVGTFLPNNQVHLEAYLAVPSMGAVLHTLNLRLFPEQLAYVINHAEDQVIIVDAVVAPLLARVRDQLTTVKQILVVGAGDTSGLGETLPYEELLGAEEPGYDWPQFDERNAAAMCYTSGTTGNPKGIVYSHRSTYLHTMAITSGSSLGVNERDRVLSIVPMFHANAWGTPYGAFFTGADLVMPQLFVQAEPLSLMIANHRPTLACGVPTIWNDLLRFAQSNPVDLSSLRMITAGGAAVPRQLIERYRDELGVEMVQGWGMTETSPLCALALPPRGTPPEEEIEWRVMAGRVVPGVEIRVTTEDGTILPNDGESVGEFEVRGPWITGSYYREDAPDRFRDGWLRTGDMGTLDSLGFMQISDRTKDVIKTGGEWISSVELENEVMAHPAVVEAAVIAVPDERWSERPLAVVVVEEGAEVDAPELVTFLSARVSRWWVPERWAFVGEVPKTSVGKFDKKQLRAQHNEGALEVVEVAIPRGG
jgi:acyl-CoA synthetase (AMP-forming)/AMP-acid ligase II